MSSHKEQGSWTEGDGSSGENDRGKPSRGARTKNHCSKWWWLYLLVVIILVVVIVIPIIFVGIKNIAQSEINKASVTLDAQLVTNPGPDQVNLQLNTTVLSNSNSSHQATIEAFNASFYLLDTKPDIVPFIHASFPETSSSSVNYVNITQDPTYAANMDQFIAYNKLVLTSETFSIGVRGNTHVILKGLPKYPVTWDKVVTMKGYNSFKGFSINSIQFHLPPEFDGATMTGTVTIPNPSVISAQFGNVTMDLYANGTYLGYSLLEYVSLVPGNNTFNMRGYVNTSLALTYVHDYLLDLDIVGNSSVNIAGQHLPYYEAALQANTIHYQLNLTEAAG